MRHYYLFLDDDRKVTDDYCQERIPIELKGVKWRHVKSYDQFVDVVVDGFLRGRFPAHVAFDHDLGKWSKTGLECAKWLMDFCLSNGLTLPSFSSHSTNAPGREAIMKVPMDYSRAISYGYKPIRDNMSFRSLAEKAELYAKNCHRKTNHYYTDEHPYEFHLEMVVRFAKEWLPKSGIDPRTWDLILAICWCHDVIEDTRQTYNDVKENTHFSVAEGAFYLTELRGKNRNERHGPEYWKGIRQDIAYIFVKCMDRYANLWFAISSGNVKMMEMQGKEMPHFIEELTCSESEPMRVVLDEMVQLGKKALARAKELKQAA